jgi:hypothetical protein
MNDKMIGEYVTRTMTTLRRFHSSDGSVIEISALRLEGILHLAMLRAAGLIGDGPVEPRQGEDTGQLTLTGCG